MTTERNSSSSEDVDPMELTGHGSGLPRLPDLLEADKGLVYWEKWCLSEGYDRIPTWRTIYQYVSEFVIPMEESMHQLVLQDPTKVSPLDGTRTFVEPVLRLKEKYEERRLLLAIRSSPAQPASISKGTSGSQHYSSQAPETRSFSCSTLHLIGETAPSMSLLETVTSNLASSELGMDIERIARPLIKEEEMPQEDTTPSPSELPVSLQSIATPHGPQSDLVPSDRPTGAMSQVLIRDFATSTVPSLAPSPPLLERSEVPSDVPKDPSDVPKELTEVVEQRIKEEEMETAPSLSVRPASYLPLTRTSLLRPRLSLDPVPSSSRSVMASAVSTSTALSQLSSSASFSGTKEVAESALELQIEDKDKEDGLCIKQEEEDERPLSVWTKSSTTPSSAKATSLSTISVSSLAAVASSSSKAATLPARVVSTRKAKGSSQGTTVAPCLDTIKKEPLPSLTTSRSGSSKAHGTHAPKTKPSDPCRFKAVEFTLPRRGCENTFKTAKLPLIPQYSMNNNVNTIVDVLQEWKFGFQGGPAIQDLNLEYGGQWKLASDKNKYLHRTAAVKLYVELVLIKGLSDEEAIQTLQRLKGDKTWRTLYRYIRDSRLALEVGKRKRSSSGANEGKDDDDDSDNDVEDGDNDPAKDVEGDDDDHYDKCTGTKRSKRNRSGPHDPLLNVLA